MLQKINYQKCPGQPKKIESEEFETLLHKYPYQTQYDPTESLGVAGSTISRRLYALEMIKKLGNWMRYEAKRRAIPT